jgi:hypothetical protein
MMPLLTLHPNGDVDMNFQSIERIDMPPNSPHPWLIAVTLIAAAVIAFTLIIF